uniref:Aminopeptidase n=1 Tax=Timema californicum TaxID=61474 RepID=A0A7R9JCS1_TIMCA|nr:unnamed protein product [Timema californicum]
MGVLGCTRNETLAHRYLRKTITSDSGIRSQDITSVYPSVYNNIYGVDFAINFLSQNFRDIIEFNASVPSVVAGIAGAISSQEQLNKIQRYGFDYQRFQIPCEAVSMERGHFSLLEQFINDNAEELGSSTTTSALNNLQTARINLEWLNTHGSTIMTWIKQQNYRLPTHIVPYHYNVVLQPNLDDDTFQYTGRVEISFNVTETTDRVQLHADDLEIDNTTIAVEPLTIWGEFDNFTTTVDSLRHIYDIKLSDYLLTGHRYRLHLNYKGYHREDMAGFYRSYYYRNGAKRWLASTQFQATSARRAFPCFDEPALKARFKVSVARTSDRHVLSNMPLENSEYDDVTGLWWDHFQETPMPMSTYLVAFVVSDFVNLTSDDGKYSTWQRSDAVDQAQYSIDVSPSVMAALENFTELDYFLPKVDQVAIPDFSAGAMENWGLVTYRERNILLVEGVTPFSYKRFVLQVIAHEFAHKWFGNLVSPLWWRYLWISEGFARYFQYFTPAEVEPDWRMEEQFVVDQVHSSLISDSLANTHAMSSDVSSPSDIRTIFGTISYNKGNDSATPDHLFESLGAISEGLSVKTVLDTWSLQEGYPLITVSRIYDSSNIYRSVTVHQGRFYLKSSERISNTQENRWWVPLTYTSQSELNFNSTTTRDWLRASQENSLITDININSTEWVIFNIQETGFYRVNYDDTNLNLIISPLNSDKFTDIYDYVLRIMETARQVIGLSEETNESLVTKLHRNQILTWQCNFGVQSCIDMASSELVKLMDDPENYLVAPDLKTVVYCNALRYGGEEEWNFLWNRYLTHNVNTEQVLILGALGCTRNETLAHSNGGVDLLATILTGIAEHVSTRDQAEEIRNLIEENQANLGTALGASQQTLETVEENLAWLDQNGGEISNWLSVSIPSTTPAPPLTTPPGGAGSFSASVFAITVSLIMTCVRFV